MSPEEILHAAGVEGKVEEAMDVAAWFDIDYFDVEFKDPRTVILKQWADSVLLRGDTRNFRDFDSDYIREKLDRLLQEAKRLNAGPDAEERAAAASAERAWQAERKAREKALKTAWKLAGARDQQRLEIVRDTVGADPKEMEMFLEAGRTQDMLQAAFDWASRSRPEEGTLDLGGVVSRRKKKPVSVDKDSTWVEFVMKVKNKKKLKLLADAIKIAQPLWKAHKTALEKNKTRRRGRG
jgi:hypothetical protein